MTMPPGSWTWACGWYAAPQPIWRSGFLFDVDVPPLRKDTVHRQRVKVALGGRRVRLVLDNRYGSALIRAELHAALSTGGASIDPNRGGRLFFGGRVEVEVPPGATIASDPLDLTVEGGDVLAISTRYLAPPLFGGFHWDGRQTGYVLPPGNIDESAPCPISTSERRLLACAVLVEREDVRSCVVAFGDSITDGAGASLDSDTRWPDWLGARAGRSSIAIVNAGISGARLLSDGMGARALARFDPDVAAQPHSRALIALLGTNDIAWPGTPLAPDEPEMTLHAMMAGYRLLIERSRAATLKIALCTLPPFEGALPGTPMADSYHTPAKERLRREVNDWIRDDARPDMVIDVDALLRDPARPSRLRKRFDCGDRLHPGDAGNRAIADAIDLDALTTIEAT